MPKIDLRRLNACFAIAEAVMKPWPRSKQRRFLASVSAVHRRLMRLATARLERMAPR